MSKMKPRTLSGFMELLPHRQAQMNWMMDILRQSYELYGFTGLDTPVIEAAEVLLAKVLGSMNAPITGFVTALSGNIRNLLYVLNAIGEKKSA